jgi:maltodextrin utilization protein YvdJ
LPVLITAFTTIWDLFLLLGFALIVWFIAKIRKVEVGYKESYILSGYLLALPTIANFVLGLITPASQWILTIILFALIAVLNIKQEKSSI